MMPPARRGALFPAAVLACFVAACGADPPEPEGTIPRDVFVGAYVELRMAAMRSPDGRVGPPAKEEILAERGITEADLLEFVDSHAPRVQLMVDIWGEIDDSLRALRTRETDPAS